MNPELIRIEPNSVPINRLIAHHMTGEIVSGDGSLAQPVIYPVDAEDVQATMAFLKDHPRWRARFHEMGAYSLRWKALVENWGKLEASCRHDNPEDTTSLLHEIMNDAIRRHHPQEYDPKRVEMLLEEPEAAQEIGNIPPDRAAQLANAVVQRLDDEGCKCYSVYISKDRYTHLVGSKSWRGASTQLVTAEDLPNERNTPAAVRLRYNRNGIDLPEFPDTGYRPGR